MFLPRTQPLIRVLVFNRFQFHKLMLSGLPEPLPIDIESQRAAAGPCGGSPTIAARGEEPGRG